ncbi:phospholipase D family protein [Rhizorhabdus wittichii]|uniref:phospholipase D family protein n=1 Tax=Rhizorhabdus wittichii TaxID=160791 RepID=UPI000379FE6D|nr:phospholipase D family protein [Rhizorhabdus wittichii]
MADFRLINCEWNREVITIRSGHPGRLRLICPFVKAPAVARVLAAAHCGDIEVITRFDLACFNEGVSDVAALERLLGLGARIRGVRALHAKLFLFGGTAAIATSANVTDAAFRRNHEFGFAATDPTIVTACEHYFEDLWRAAGEDLTGEQLGTWIKILDHYRRLNTFRAKEELLPDFGVTVEQASPFALSAIALPHDNQGFIKFFGTARDRAPRTMTVSDLLADDGANWACTYPANKPPRQVDDGDIIYMGRLVHSPNDLQIFGKATARRHRDDEDFASAADIARRPWKVNWPRYVRVHDGHFIDGTLDDGVSMSAMLTELGADAFASTRRNAQRGLGNTDPFASYGRKAHMLLTNRSRGWIEERLEAALRRHGEIDVTEERFLQPSV